MLAILWLIGLVLTALSVFGVTWFTGQLIVGIVVLVVTSAVFAIIVAGAVVAERQTRKLFR